MSKKYFAYLLLVLATLFWSGNFLVGKFASQYEVPPFSLNFYRWLFAWLILAPFTIQELFNKRSYILENYKYYTILGITSVTIFNSIVYYSLNFTQVISGVLMISTIPVMIIFISSILKTARERSPSLCAFFTYSSSKCSFNHRALLTLTLFLLIYSTYIIMRFKAIQPSYTLILLLTTKIKALILI